MAAQSEQDAIKKVPQHVSPKPCFVWFMNTARGWEPCPGTGCAHWVAHEKGWNSGKNSSNGCKLNFLLRVADVVTKAGGEVASADVKVGNVWATNEHCGIVSKVTPPKNPTKEPRPTIEIENCSSAQGKVAKDDWIAHFQGGGKFYKG